MNKEFHPSQRGYFAGELREQMKENENIVLIVCDLGYGVFDKIREDFPDRFYNVMASEQAGLGVAVGMSLEGKTVFIYSITNFLLYRGYEWIRNYIDHENIPVKLVASGRDKDYEHDGISHWSEDAKHVLDNFPNIEQYWPQEKEDVPEMVKEMIENGKPSFISLKR